MPDKLFNFITLEGLQAFKEESESKSNGAYASKMTISQNATTGVVTFKLYAEDNTLLDTKTLDLDTEHIIKSVSLDYTNKLLVFTMNDDTTLNCDISDLIDNLSSDIQTAIDNEATTRANEITRVEGLITTEENRAKGVENSKVDKVANATENNIALFDSNGNVKDSGKSINDVGKVATVSVGGGTPIQPDQDKNIDLPAYPTRLSLSINNVDNTSDANKPVSTAQRTAIDSAGHKIDLEIDNTTFKIKAKLYDKNNTLISTSNEIDLPLESVVVGGSYDSVNKKVVLTLQNGTTIEFSVADLIYGLQSEITAQNPLSSDLVDDTNNAHKFVSANEKAQITTNQNDIAGIKNGENLDSFADVEEELEAKADKSTTYTKTDVDNLLDDKADKTEIPTKTSDLENDSGFLTQHQDVSGKEDKSNKVSAFQSTPDNTHYPTEKLVKDSLDNKVDKVSGKGLSTNDYTTVEKQKLANIEAGAEVNDVNSVNGKTGAVVLDSDDISDTNKTHKFVSEAEKSTWNGKQDTISDLAAIRSGASAGATAVQDSNYVHTDNNYSTAEKNKLAGLSNYDDTEVRGLITTETTRATSQENKALHFKGAFDSDDGKTRQTGIAIIDGTTGNWSIADSTGDYISFYQPFNTYYEKVATLNDMPNIKVSGIFNVVFQNDWGVGNEVTVDSSANTTYNIGVCIAKSLLSSNDSNGLNKYLSQYPLVVQYKLATAYTDNGIIEGETILPLDSGMANKIRQRVVDGLNLLPPSCFYPNNNIEANGTLGTYPGYSAYYKVPVKPNTAYTVSYAGSIIYNLGVATYDINGNFISYESWSNSKGTTANNVYFISFDVPNTYSNIMLNDNNHSYPYSDFNQKEHITNDEATLLKNEYNKTTNLFNKNTITIGYGVIVANGNLQADSSLATSDYIELKYGFNYINNLKGGWSGYFGICFYDANKNYLEGYNTNSTTYNYFDLSNANAKYVRFCWFNDSSNTTYYSNPDSIMFNEGTEVKPYNKCYGPIVHTTEAFEAVGGSKNLFDKSKIRVGYELQGSDGAYHVNSSWWASENIYVQPNTPISYSGNTDSYLFFYQADGTFITYSSSLRVTPSNCYIVRINGRNSDNSKDSAMVNYGSEPLPHKEYTGDIVFEKDLPKQAYLHHITFYGTIESTGNFIVHFDIKSDSAEAFTMSSIATYLDSIVHYTGNNAISCSGYLSYGANGLKYPIVSVKGYSNSDIYITALQYSSGVLLTYNCNGTIADVIE